MICDKVNSWPYAQAIVQENRYINSYERIKNNN